MINVSGHLGVKSERREAINIIYYLSADKSKAIYKSFAQNKHEVRTIFSIVRLKNDRMRFIDTRRRLRSIDGGKCRDHILGCFF